MGANRPSRFTERALALTVVAVVIVMIAAAASLGPPRIPAHTGMVELELRAFAAKLTPSEPSANLTIESLTGPFALGALTTGHVQVALTIDGEQVYAGLTHDFSYGFPYLAGQNGAFAVELRSSLPANDSGETVSLLLYLAPWNGAEIRTSANVGAGSNPYTSNPTLYASETPSNVSGEPTRLGEWNITIPPFSGGLRTTDVTTRGWAQFNITPPPGMGCEWIASNELWPGYGSLMGGHANGSVSVRVRGPSGVNLTAMVGVYGPTEGASYAVVIYGPSPRV